MVVKNVGPKTEKGGVWQRLLDALSKKPGSLDQPPGGT
jgi:hypothetical protein